MLCLHVRRKFIFKSYSLVLNKNVQQALPPLLHDVSKQRSQYTNSFHLPPLNHGDLPPLNHADLPPLLHGNRNNPSNLLTSEVARGANKGERCPAIYRRLSILCFRFFNTSLGSVQLYSPNETLPIKVQQQPVHRIEYP